jgi:hypothetical protein
MVCSDTKTSKIGSLSTLHVRGLLASNGVLAVKIMPDFGTLRENEAAFDVAVAYITSGDNEWGRSILVALGITSAALENRRASMDSAKGAGDTRRAEELHTHSSITS